MSNTGPQPVVSGVPYLVRQVNGRCPALLEDFVGDAVLVLERPPSGRRDGVATVSGCGVLAERAVRFYEKGLTTGGKDVRVWRIAVGPDGGFQSEHVAAI